MSNLAIKQPRPQRIIMWIASTTDEKFYVSLTARNDLIDAETNRKDKSISFSIDLVQSLGANQIC